MADKGGLQLLPNTRKSIKIRIPGENRLVYIGGALIALVLVIYGGLWFYGQNLQSRVNDADNQLVSLDKSRNLQNENQLLTLSKQITTASQVLNGHVHWSNAFSKIEAELQPNVQFESISGLLSDDSMQIRAQTDNYSTIAKQIAAFVADDSIKDISLGNVSTLTNGKLDFSAKITFDQAKFLNTSSSQ